MGSGYCTADSAPWDCPLPFCQVLIGSELGAPGLSSAGSDGSVSMPKMMEARDARSASDPGDRAGGGGGHDQILAQSAATDPLMDPI